MIYVTEKEMIQRYSDSLKRAADSANTLYLNPGQTRPQLFVDIIEGIKTAAGSAHQLAQSRRETKWLNVRDLLEEVIETAKTLPVFVGNDSQMWAGIRDSLKSMSELGFQLAFNTKQSTEMEILGDLKIREDFARTRKD